MTAARFQKRRCDDHPHRDQNYHRRSLADWKPISHRLRSTFNLGGFRYGAVARRLAAACWSSAMPNRAHRPPCNSTVAIGTREAYLMFYYRIITDVFRPELAIFRLSVPRRSGQGERVAAVCFSRDGFPLEPIRARLLICGNFGDSIKQEGIGE